MGKTYDVVPMSQATGATAMQGSLAAAVAALACVVGFSAIGLSLEGVAELIIGSLGVVAAG